MNTPSTILSRAENGILTLTLNRPEKFNAVTEEMSTAFCAALRAAGDDHSVRCIVIRGAGRGFCAGQDIDIILKNNPADLGSIVQRCFNPMILLITGVEKPVIAAVHGAAAGAGANLALACDYVIASTEANFTQSFVKIGLIPDSGGTFFLPRLVGLAKARELMMLGEKVPASEAAELGMIQRAIEPQNFEGAVSELAQKLAALPTKALALTKRLLHDGFAHSFQEQLAAEAAAQRSAGRTHDYHEGLKAFVEKRPPRFTGR